MTNPSGDAGEPRTANGEALTHTGLYNVNLTPAVLTDLLDPGSWATMLGLFAHTLNVAVALVDAQGKLLGTCENPQSIWRLARAARSEREAGCLFCLGERIPCTAASDAMGKDAPVLARDFAGFAHTASSLSMGGVHVGTLLAGQVFDRFPEPLPLERLANDFGLSAQHVWHLATQQRPISRSQLAVYGSLLGSLGRTFLRERYGTLLQRRFTETDQQFQLLVDGVTDYALFTVDTAGLVTSWNRGARRLLGYTEADILCQPFECVFSPADIENGLPKSDLQAAAHEGRSASERWYIRKDGSRLFASSVLTKFTRGNADGYGLIMHDITGRKHTEEYISHLAYHDALTGLPTRTLLHDRLDTAIARAVRHRGKLAVLTVDLDEFKLVNDAMGHDAGDNVLVRVARSLESTVRRSDTVARMGGDEFMVLLDDVNSRESAEHVSEKLLRGLDSVIQPGAQTHSITASVGISLYPDDGDNAEELVRNSDAAMYHAKKGGGNSFRFYSAEMNLKAVKKQSLEARLRYALEQKEFLLHYQPMVNLETSEFTGVEALVRWQPAAGGLVPPSEFVPFAEDCGLIVQIGNWVLREACRQARAWQQAGLAALPIAVNVSAVEFRRKGFVEGVRAVLAETGLEAGYLELELTEGVLMEDAQATISVLQELKDVGVRLAVDDFGTGYSSLSYLRQFPVDTLKIDQSFVRRISSDSNDSRIVSAIINLGKKLDYRLIAEGIETQEQRAYLQAEHCQEGQGYLFSRPVSAAQFGDLLQTGIPLSA